MDLKGLIAAPHTPMLANGDLNLPRVEQQAEQFTRSEVAGVFVGGSTGEGASLTVDERQSLTARWCDVARGTPLKVIAHVGHNVQRDAICLSASASSAGVDGIAAFAPSYFRPEGPADLLRFLRPIADAAATLPFYFYDIPSMTGVEVRVVELLRLAPQALPTLAGVKATTNDLMGLQECLAFDDGRYNILFGLDEMLLTVLPLGVEAAVGSTYNFASPLYLKIIEAFGNSDWETARRLQLKSVAWIRVLAAQGFMPSAKFAMSLIGVDCGPCRDPLSNLSDAQKATIKRELEALDFFAWQTV